MPRDHSKQGYRGIGFVTFSSPESVEKVMANKHFLNGHEIAIDRATPKEEPSGSGNGNGNGGLLHGVGNGNGMSNGHHKAGAISRPGGPMVPMSLHGQRRSFDNGARIIGPGLLPVNGGPNPASIIGPDSFGGGVRSLSEDRDMGSMGGGGGSAAAAGLELLHRNGLLPVNGFPGAAGGPGAAASNPLAGLNFALGLGGLGASHGAANAAAAAAFQNLAKAQAALGAAAAAAATSAATSNADSMSAFASQLGRLGVDDATAAAAAAAAAAVASMPGLTPELSTALLTNVMAAQTAAGGGRNSLDGSVGNGKNGMGGNGGVPNGHHHHNGHHDGSAAFMREANAALGALNNASAMQHLMAAAAKQQAAAAVGNGGGGANGNGGGGNGRLDPASVLKRLENPAIATARAGPRIFVGKLSKDCTEADVKEYFMRFGYVMDVYLPKSKDNKAEHRGFGFVTFETDAAIQRVVSHGNHRLRGATIAIDIAMPKAEDDSGGAGGGLNGGMSGDSGVMMHGGGGGMEPSGPNGGMSAAFGAAAGLAPFGHGVF